MLPTEDRKLAYHARKSSVFFVAPDERRVQRAAKLLGDVACCPPCAVERLLLNQVTRPPGDTSGRASTA